MVDRSWPVGVLRMPPVCGTDLAPAVAEALAGMAPAALEIRREEEGLVWAVRAPADRLPVLMERLRVASGGRILPGEVRPPSEPEAVRFLAPEPPVPFFPPPAPGTAAALPGAGFLAALRAAPPGTGWRVTLAAPHPDGPALARLAGPAFAGRLPEASAWELTWRVIWAAVLGGTLLFGVSLNLLLVLPVVPPEAAFAAGAFGLLAALAGVMALSRFWVWRHLPREALQQKLRTALMEAQMEVWGEAAPAPGGWRWRTARLPARFPLSLHEAALLWLPPPDFPVETVAAPAGRADMPAPGGFWTLPAERGVPVGRQAGSETVVRIPWPQLPILILGGTGSGKSSFMLNLAETAIRRAAEGDPEAPGLLVLDPHGPLARAFLARLAHHARRRPEILDRLVLIDPSWDHAVPLNMFCAEDHHWAISTLLQTGQEIWRDYWGPRMAGTLLAAASMLCAYNRQAAEGLRLGFRHVPFALFNREFRHEELMSALPAADLGTAVLLDFQMGQAVDERAPYGWQVEVASPIVSKVIALDHPWMRAALAAPRLADMVRWCRERRWVVAAVPAGDLGGENAFLVAAWFYNLWEWALRRAGGEAPAPVWIFLDEVHRLARGLPLEQTLSEIRKYGGVPILASQSLTVLREEREGITAPLVPAMLANAGTLVVFRPDPMDLPILERALGWRERVAGEGLRPDIPAFHFYLRAMVEGRWAPLVLVDARGAYPEIRDVLSEEDRAWLRQEALCRHPEDYIRVEDGIRHEQENTMRLMTPAVREALLQIEVWERERLRPSGAPPSILERLGL